MVSVLNHRVTTFNFDSRSEQRGQRRFRDVWSCAHKHIHIHTQRDFKKILDILAMLVCGRMRDTFASKVDGCFCTGSRRFTPRLHGGNTILWLLFQKWRASRGRLKPRVLISMLCRRERREGNVVFEYAHGDVLRPALLSYLSG